MLAPHYVIEQWRTLGIHLLIRDCFVLRNDNKELLRSIHLSCFALRYDKCLMLQCICHVLKRNEDVVLNIVNKKGEK